MDVAETTGDGGWRRLALLCLGGAALGTALACLIPAAAQADEGDDGSGLGQLALAALIPLLAGLGLCVGAARTHRLRA